jgi:methylmalonyl-CoA mutase N-terminal domain/subunit
VIVGVNKFQDSSNIEPKLNVVDPAIEERQVKRLKEFKNSRDRIKVEEVLNKLVVVAEGDENVMPHIVNAIKSRVTLGEINGSFKQVFGTYQPRISF